MKTYRCYVKKCESTFQAEETIDQYGNKSILIPDDWGIKYGIGSCNKIITKPICPSCIKGK
jgi:hypothetical protein